MCQCGLWGAYSLNLRFEVIRTSQFRDIAVAARAIWNSALSVGDGSFLVGIARAEEWQIISLSHRNLAETLHFERQSWSFLLFYSPREVPEKFGHVGGVELVLNGVDHKGGIASLFCAPGPCQLARAWGWGFCVSCERIAEIEHRDIAHERCFDQ